MINRHGDFDPAEIIDRLLHLQSAIEKDGSSWKGKL
jgi:hypothetical protein